MTRTDYETARDRHVVEILVALKTAPERDRLDVLAVAIRAALDSGIVRYTPKGGHENE